MRQSSPIRGQLSPKRGQLSPECAERAMAWLRARHPVKAPEEIESATHGMVSAATAKKWMGRQSAPSFVAAMALIAAYGPEFLHAVMDQPPAWLCAASRAERLAALEVERARIAREMASLTGDA